MFLFIFESIGTSELLMIGVVALMFLGPRRLPELARKLGKIMAEFRSTTNEFKQTWEREVNFEEEARAMREMASDAKATVASAMDERPPQDVPAVKQIDPAAFPHHTAVTTTEAPAVPEPVHGAASAPEKKDWL